MLSITGAPCSELTDIHDEEQDFFVAADGYR
jgi:hypothetical protein